MTEILVFQGSWYEVMTVYKILICAIKLFNGSSMELGTFDRNFECEFIILKYEMKRLPILKFSLKPSKTRWRLELCPRPYWGANTLADKMYRP